MLSSETLLCLQIDWAYIEFDQWWNVQVQPKRIEFCINDANFQYKILYWKLNSKITEYFRISNTSIIIIKCILCFAQWNVWKGILLKYMNDNLRCAQWNIHREKRFEMNAKDLSNFFVVYSKQICILINILHLLQIIFIASTKKKNIFL